MEQNTFFEEITFHHGPADDFKQRIIKTTVVLSVITIIELGLGLLMHFVDMPYVAHLIIKGIICILTLAKAFYIVSIFMHLGDEIRNLIMTIVVPLMLFIWFITAFLWDGHSFKNLRNKFDKSFEERTATPAAHGNDANTHEIKPGTKD